MKSLTKTSAFVITIVLSVALFFATFWANAYQGSTPYWVESIGYFMLTYICIFEFSKKVDGLNPWFIGLAVIIGVLLIFLPGIIMYFREILGSVLIAIGNIIAILLAVICYKDRRVYSFILSYVILVLFNSVVSHTWNTFILSM